MRFLRPMVVMSVSVCCAYAADEMRDAPVHLTLREAIIASAGSSGVRLSSADRLGSDAQVVMARADLLPQIWAEGILKRGTELNRDLADKTQPDDPSPGTTLDGRLRLSQALIDLSAWYRLEGARENDRAFMARGQVALEIAAAAAAEAYVDLLQSRLLVDTRRRDVELAIDLVHLAEAQVKAGLSENLAVTRAQVQAAIAETELLAQENRAERARITLARALDLPPTTALVPTTAFGPDLCRMPDQPSMPDKAVERALKDRAEVRSEEAAFLAAMVASRAIRAGYSGRLELFADGGRIGPAWSRTVTTWTLGVQYTLPLFDGLRRAGQVDEQEAKVLRASIGSKDLRIQVETDVREMMIDHDSAKKLQEVTVRRMALSVKELEEARARFAGGLDSNADVISAQQSFGAASSEEIAARAGVAISKARLARAIGSATAME